MDTSMATLSTPEILDWSIDPSSNQSTDIQQSEQRFIRVGVEQCEIVFPSDVVADISIIDRAQILALPFYDRAILGIIHRSGQIVPLVSLRQIFALPTGLMAETLTIVRLNPSMQNLGGVGLIVDKTLGTSSVQELPADLFTSNLSTGLPGASSTSNPQMRLFRPEMLGDSLWRSLRW
jgi:chemotaxis signal transduction protein